MKSIIVMCLIVVFSVGCSTSNWTVNKVSVTGQPMEEDTKGYSTIETIGLTIGLILVFGAVFVLLSSR